MTERNILETAVMALYAARRDNYLDRLMSYLHRTAVSELPVLNGWRQ